jgi:DNA-binding transcriptional ArsR family regulator
MLNIIAMPTPQTIPSGSSDVGAVFAALADPTRRAILDRLAGGPATVGELAAPFEMSLPAVSRHLKVLESAGLLERRVVGRTHHCRAVPAPMRAAADWIEQRSAFWDRALESLRDYVEHSPRERADDHH